MGQKLCDLAEQNYGAKSDADLWTDAQTTCKHYGSVIWCRKRGHNKTANVKAASLTDAKLFRVCRWEHRI